MIPAPRVDEKEKVVVNSEVRCQLMGEVKSKWDPTLRHQGACCHGQGVVSFVNVAEHRVPTLPVI